VSAESRAGQSVSGVQCTQSTDSLSQMLLPASARNTISTPVLAVNNDTPGCERLASAVDRRLHLGDFADDSRQSTAAAAADDDDDDDDDDDNCDAVLSGCSTSAVPHQPTISLSLPQPQVYSYSYFIRKTHNRRA